MILGNNEIKIRKIGLGNAGLAVAFAKHFSIMLMILIRIGL
jgi:hypothetical protein